MAPGSDSAAVGRVLGGGGTGLPSASALEGLASRSTVGTSASAGVTVVGLPSASAGVTVVGLPSASAGVTVVGGGGGSGGSAVGGIC